MYACPFFFWIGWLCFLSRNKPLKRKCATIKDSTLIYFFGSRAHDFDGREERFMLCGRPPKDSIATWLLKSEWKFRIFDRSLIVIRLNWFFIKALEKKFRFNEQLGSFFRLIVGPTSQSVNIMSVWNVDSRIVRSFGLLNTKMLGAQLSEQKKIFSWTILERNKLDGT